jgi:hypothetical protein
MSMNMKLRVWMVPFALAVGCSDDGVQGQNDAGGTSAATGTGNVSSGDGADDGSDPTGAGMTSPSTTSGDDSGSGGTAGPADSGSGSDSGTGTGTDSGSGSDSGSDSGTTGDVCEPPDDGASIGLDCAGGGMCPPGYTCQGFSGIVFQESCQILCTQDCECPMGTTCIQVVDKGGIPWMQCG